MKYKMDDRFKTSDDIASLEDFDLVDIPKTKEEIKEEIKIDTNPPENYQTEEVFEPKETIPQQFAHAGNNVQQTSNPDIQVNNKFQGRNFDYQDTNNKKNTNMNPKLKQDSLTSNTKKIIEIKNVGLAYGREVILSNVNIDINKGDFVYLVGESGAGKSSIIKMLYREIKASKGEILIDTQDIVRLRNSKLPKLRRKVGVIFQDYKLLPDKTIFKNVAFSLEVTGYPRRKIKEKVMDALRKVGIANQAYKYPNELSGGQQQRAAIARAIVDEPLILVADEPTGNLDPENALAIMELLEEINNEGTTIVMATHDVGIVNNFPKRVILLGQGKVLKESQGEYIYE